MKNIELGSRVKDSVTSFEGIAIAKCNYMNGCVRYEVQPQGLKDNKPIETLWIDESQLIVKGLIAIKKSKDPGGPGSIPSEMSHP